MGAVAEKVKHVHVEVTSTDCDGRMDRNSIDTREFHTVLGWQLGIGEGVVSRVEYTVDGDFYRGYASYPTDEGSHSTYLYECDDETCDVKERSQRDHSAEAMGY